MGKLRVVIIGLGVIGREQLKAFQHLDNVDVVGGYDADKEVAQRVCQEFGIRSLRSVEEGVDPDVTDAVSVCTPEGLHVSPALMAIEAGQHVLIEKPLASSREDAQKLLRAARASDRSVVMVGQTLRFDPYYLAARKLLMGGAVGRVNHVSARRSNSITNALRTRGRTSVSLFLGVHDLDFCHWVLQSRAARVYAVGVKGTLSREYGYDVADTVLGTIEFEAGSCAGVEFSWCLPLEGVDVLDAHFEVMGDEGQLAVYRQQERLVVTSRKAQKAEEIDVSEVGGVDIRVGGLDREVAAFVEAVGTGAAPPVGIEDGYIAMLSSLAMDESAKKGEIVVPAYEDR